MRLRRLGVFGVVGVGLVLLSISAELGSPARPQSPRAYLDHALTLMRTEALYAPGVDWPAVMRAGRAWSSGVKSTGDTYYVIHLAVDRLVQAGDLHAMFLAPAETVSFPASLESAPAPPPRVSLVRRRLGYISLPTIAATPTSRTSQRYASVALTHISELQSRVHPCGWIVDLRDDSGGDMAPMLWSVGPILGSGRLIGFRDKHGTVEYDSYRESALVAGNQRFPAPVKVDDFKPSPPVAVLTGQPTFSAGEAVTVAFRGRPHTRSFGAPTGGAPNAPGQFALSDGAALRFALHFDVDRTGTTYRHAIAPDVAVPETQAAAPLLAAANWLLSTEACTRTS